MYSTAKDAGSTSKIKDVMYLFAEDASSLEDHVYLFVAERIVLSLHLIPRISE